MMSARRKKRKEIIVYTFCILSKYLLRYVRTFVPYSILLTPYSFLPPLPCFTFLPFSIRYLAKPGKGGEGRGIRPPHSMRKGSENETEFGQSSMKGGRTQKLIHMAHIYTHKIDKDTPLAHLKGGRPIHRLTGELSSCYLIPARLSFSWTEVASLPPPLSFRPAPTCAHPYPPPPRRKKSFPPLSPSPRRSVPPPPREGRGGGSRDRQWAFPCVPVSGYERKRERERRSSSQLGVPPSLQGDREGKEGSQIRKKEEDSFLLFLLTRRKRARTHKLITRSKTGAGRRKEEAPCLRPYVLESPPPLFSFPQ